jgi:hypothetical protein
MTNQISAQLKAKLRNARAKFAKAEPAESNSVANRKVADGNYTAKVVGLEFAEFGKHPIIRFTYEITDADKKPQESAVGQLVETRFNLDTDEGPSYIKRDFGRFGYDDVNDLLDDPDATNALFIQLLGLNPICKIAVSMDDTDQWQNVFLNDVLEMDDEEAEVVEEVEEVKKPVSKPASAKKDTAKDAKKKKAPEPEPKEEIESDDEDGEGTEEETEEVEETEESSERELEIEDIVEVSYKGKDVAATVISIDEAASTVKVQIGNKRVIVPLENVFLLEG